MTNEEITKHLSDLSKTHKFPISTNGYNGLINIMCFRHSTDIVINIISKSNILLIDSVFMSDVFGYIYLVDLTNLKNISI